MRFQLDCTSDSGGRLEGTLTWEGGEYVPFSGTLELLRLFEDHTARRGPWMTSSAIPSRPNVQVAAVLAPVAVGLSSRPCRAESLIGMAAASSRAHPWLTVQRRSSNRGLP